MNTINNFAILEQLEFKKHFTPDTTTLLKVRSPWRGRKSPYS